MVLASLLLGWRPLLDPLDLNRSAWWLTLIPLAFGVAVVYKAVRMQDLRRYWLNVLLMSGQIVLAMVLLAVGIHALVEWIVPAFA